MSQVKDRVVAVLADMAGLPPEQVTPETTFESLALDSLDLVEMTLTLESELGIQVDPDSLGELVTIQDAVDVIEAAIRLAA